MLNPTIIELVTWNLSHLLTKVLFRYDNIVKKKNCTIMEILKIQTKRRAKKQILIL